MKWMLAVRWWHGLVSVVLAAGVGVVTNVATSAFSLALTAALVALVLAQAVLSVWQGIQDHRDRQAARDELLGLLRPEPPHRRAPVGSARDVVHWLTAPFSPTPLWGRGTLHAQLVAWCVDRDPAAGVVRVLTGPAGVGKSRLALAVAESLPSGWAAGHLQLVGDGLVERIHAAGDPTLVLVDDADKVADLHVLIAQATRYPKLIRLLLLTRTEESLPPLPQTVRLQVNRPEVLAPIGEAADRQRWFHQAVRAYTRVLRASPPRLPDLPVGRDEDTLLVLHARALLAVLGRAGTRTWSLADITTELITLETDTWKADLSHLPAGCDVGLLTAAVTVLLLLPARTREDAAELLRRVPQFSHDAAHESRAAVARWAHRRYPPGPGHRIDLRPHLIAERLLLNTLAHNHHLLHDDDIPAAAPVLAQAYANFPDAIDVLAALLTRRRALLAGAIAAILATGVTGDTLDRTLANLIDPSDSTVLPPRSTNPGTNGVRTGFFRSLRFRRKPPPAPAETRQAEPEHLDTETTTALIALDPPLTFRHLAVAHRRLAVAYHRELVRTEPGRYRPDLARSLYHLGNRLNETSRYQEALPFAEEAISHYRELVEIDSDHHRPHLAVSLNNFADCLAEVGRYREAVRATDEAVTHYRELAHADPGGYRPELVASLTNLGSRLNEVGRYQEALTAADEAVTIQRKLADAGGDRHRCDLARSLTNLGNCLEELGRFEEAARATDEAVAIQRDLVRTDSTRYRPDLAVTLNNHGIHLNEVGRSQEALTVADEAVAINRELARTDSARHRPDLAISLTNLGNRLNAVGRLLEAVTVANEAVAIQRGLAGINPARHHADLAISLTSLGNHLFKMRRFQEALPVTQEALTIRRELAATEPDRHSPDLASALYNVALVETASGDPGAALDALREAVVVRKACAERNPELHGPRYREAVAELRTWLDRTRDSDQR